MGRDITAIVSCFMGDVNEMMERNNLEGLQRWSYEILPGKRINFQMSHHILDQMNKEQILQFFDDNTEKMIREMWKEMVKEEHEEEEMHV